jgi:NADPH:quinone reductase-like Zn-dependent oxidoreductase
MALQLAKAMGGKVVILSSSAEKMARARASGADHAVNYKATPEWSDAIWKATNGNGINIVVESAGSTLGQAMKTVAPGGFVGVVGFLGGFETQIPIVPMIESILTMKGIAVGSRDQFEAMNRAIETTNVKPVISHTLPFEKAAEAFTLMDKGGHFGKICIELS